MEEAEELCYDRGYRVVGLGVCGPAGHLDLQGSKDGRMLY